jgi:PAS domain S-box-containing protein
MADPGSATLGPAETHKSLKSELDDLKLLQAVSSELISEQNIDALYQKLVNAAVGIMRSDFASMQMFHSEHGPRGALRLLASRGFSLEAQRCWEWVSQETASSCGEVLRSGRRVVAADVSRCEFLIRLGGLEAYLSAGIHSMQSTPLISRSGKLVGMISTHWRKPHQPSEGDLRIFDILVRQAADLVERTRAEDRLREIAAIVEHSTDAIISIDLDGVIRSWNRGAESLYGHASTEIIGQPVHVLLPRNRENEEPAILERIRHGETVESYETVRCRKDGTTVDISLTVSPVRDSAGRLVGASKVARDITERVRARETLERTVSERTAQLQDTVAELEAFSYSIAHDMRAPLRAMNGYARFLEKDYGQLLPADGKNFLNRIASGAGRLDGLITDVLNYSKLSRGQMPLERVEIEQLTREIVESYPGFSSSGSSIDVQCPMPAVVGNPAALTQCISNLLSNAIKFVSPGKRPQVRVGAEAQGDVVRVLVRDNGIGIDAAGMERIFRMFQRLNPAAEFEGNGIGLTIVRKAVERMGGRVGVDSSPGAGSTFWFELKCAE